MCTVSQLLSANRDHAEWAHGSLRGGDEQCTRNDGGDGDTRGTKDAHDADARLVLFLETRSWLHNDDSEFRSYRAVAS